jgi:single-stranded-DNA-specific exonuclease
LETVAAVRNVPTAARYPDRFPAAAASAARLARAVKNGETIAVFGDYDCDGICAAAVVAGFLKKLNARLIVRLPLRSEGYGLRPQQVKELVQKGASLIVTVDNGTSAAEAARAAKDLGADLIVTDHHEPPKHLPPTPYLVNPKLSKEGYAEYSGAGVAYLFCCEAARLLNLPEPAELLDLVALATVADVCPVTGENFALSRKGLFRMREKPRPGIAALAEAARVKKLGGYALAWQLGPRINAAGRMADPALAYRLLTTENVNEAANLAKELDRLNGDRQELVEKAFKECLENHKRRAFPVFVTEYPHGIVGVVAGKLAEYLCRPILVGSLEGGLVRASGRTTGGFDLFGALVECQERTRSFVSLGGHRKAAGAAFEQKDAGKISAVLNGIALRDLKVEDITKTIDVDAALDRPVTPEEVAELDALEPFGEENPEPVFYVSGPVEVVKQDAGWALVRLGGLKMFVKPEDLQSRLEAVVNLRLDGMGEVTAQKVDVRPFSLTRDYLAERYQDWKAGRRVPAVAERVFEELKLAERRPGEKKNLLASSVYREFGLQFGLQL